MALMVGKWLLVIPVVYLACLGRGASGQDLATFTKSVTCRLQERLNHGSAKLRSPDLSGLVRCAAACVDQCSAVSVDEDDHCYHHKDHLTNFYCSDEDAFFDLYYKNRCENGGQWDPVKLTCKCVGGWVGYRCERYPDQCRELSSFGYADSIQSPTFIKPKAYPAPFLVYCSCNKFQARYITYIAMNKGRYDNTLSWSHYVSGFYHDERNYWIGLEKIKLLVDDGKRFLHMRSDLNFKYTTEVKHVFSNFSIGPASTGYKLTAKSVKSNSDNCLTPVQGVPFSTADRDNDQDSSNCARDGRAGWWFKTCDVGCNPLGPKTYWKLSGQNLDGTNATIDLFFED